MIPGIERAQEVIQGVTDKVTEVAYNAMFQIDTLGSRILNSRLGRVALVAPEVTAIGVQALTPASAVASTENCGYEATHPEYEITAGARYVDDAPHTRLHVNSIDVPGLSPDCDAEGDRTVRVFVQTRGRNGNWGPFSNGAVISSDAPGRYFSTLTTKPFTAVKGPSNRDLRIAATYGYTPKGAKKPTATRTIPGPVMRYGHRGDGR